MRCHWRLTALMMIALLWQLIGCTSNSSTPTPNLHAQHERGLILFQSYCATCHQHDGAGVANSIPPLAGSPWVSGIDGRIIRIALQGLRGPVEISGVKFELEMPGFGPMLRDEELAEVLSYVRQRFANAATPISASRVAQVRAQTADRAEYWTAAELLAIP